MIQFKRKAFLAEIKTAVAVGAAADQWAASAAQRLGKLSADFPPESPCRETFPFHGQPDDTPEPERRLPSGWWLVPAVILGSGIIGTTVAGVVALVGAMLS
ncbi:hypothetical protein ACN9JG_06170 [Cereibacter azotoformans]|uniref:hypothetical protein n=1 Tax=Cereibacter azotoformans TaxID=43057 RepID=UPI003B22139A